MISSNARTRTSVPLAGCNLGGDISAPRLAELQIADLFNPFGSGRWTRNEEWIAYFNGCLVKCVARVASFGLEFETYRSIGKSQKNF